MVRVRPRAKSTARSRGTEARSTAWLGRRTGGGWRRGPGTLGGARHGSGTRPGWMTEMIERWKEGPCEICKTHNNSEEEEGSGGTGCRRLVSLPDPPRRSQFDLSPEDDPIAARRAGRASPTRPAPTGRGSPRPVGSRGRAKKKRGAAGRGAVASPPFPTYRAPIYIIVR